jgi:hypothetical protein
LVQAKQNEIGSKLRDLE